MPIITIQGTPISFPDSGSDPNWAPVVIEFAQAVEAALQGFVGPFDVAPQTYTMTANLNATPVDLPNLTFPTADVRGVFIRYTVFRSTDSTTAYESGDIIATYSASNPSSNKWDVIQRRNGDGKLSITFTDSGQVQFTSEALSGINHAGKITYTASALSQST